MGLFHERIMNKTSPILISGATGLVGKSLVSRLRRDYPGQEIRVLTRRPNSLGEEAGSLFKTFHWEPDSGELDASALEDVSTIVHLAGEPVAQRWTARVKRRIQSSRIDGLHLLRQACLQHGHRPRVVSASAIGYYAPGDGMRDERSGCGDGFLANVVRDWEKAAVDLGDLGGGHAIVRIGLVLSDRGGALAPLLPLYRFGLGAPLASGLQWQSWIHIEDLSRLLVDIIHDRALSGVFNGVAPNPVVQREFSQCLASALGRPHFLPHVPAWALRLRFGRAADALLASHRIASIRLEEIGFQFDYPTLRQSFGALFPK